VQSAAEVALGAAQGHADRAAALDDGQRATGGLERAMDVAMAMLTDLGDGDPGPCRAAATSLGDGPPGRFRLDMAVDA
jgi:hypothetical protein